MRLCHCFDCDSARANISARISRALGSAPPPPYVAGTREVRRSVDGAIIASGSPEFIAAIARNL